MAKEVVLSCRQIVEGVAEGEALVTNDAISFMGSVNPQTGYIIERGHEIEGACIKDKVLVFPFSKGSTGGSYMLYETVKNGVGPSCIINTEAESIVVIGAIISDLPMVDKVDVGSISTGDYVYLDATNETVKVIKAGP